MLHIADLMFNKRKGEELDQLGFTVMPMLNAEFIERLNYLYKSFEAKGMVEMEFFTSIWSKNMEFRKATDIGIQQILKPEIDKHVADIQSVFSNLMVKRHGQQSSLLPHQDWSFVDEPEFDSVTVWIPLVDVDDNNGNMQVVPRSHRINNYLRPRFVDAPFRKEISEDELKKKMKSIPMKAGEALFINSRTIHASPPNLSSKNRIAVSIVIAPQQATLFHWVMTENKNNGTIKRLKVNSDFFWQNSCFDSLENLTGDSIHFIPDKHLDVAEFTELIK